MTDYLYFEVTGQIQPNATPFNDYVNYNTNFPWLDYTDAIGEFFSENLETEGGDTLDTESGVPIGLE